VRSLALLGLVFVLLALTAVASPWVAWGVAGVAGRSFDFGRVYHRVFEVLLLVALVVTWRRLDLGGPTDIGFTRTGRMRQVWAGIHIGFGGLAVGLGVAALLGGVVPDLRFPPGKTVYKALLGLVAAIEVGMLEEALFRGVLLRRFSLDAGRAGGVAAATGVYALVHGLRKVRTAGAVDAWSGVEYTIALLGRLVRPAALAPLAGLAALGLLLVAARLSSRALWLPIGIHISWVAVFRVGRLFFETRPEPRWLVGTGWPPLVGGAAGMIAVAVGALLLVRGIRSGRISGRELNGA
jgi:membrane protease YdiL (CAAX protease family)